MSTAGRTDTLTMTRFQLRLMAVIFCSQATSILGEDALPSMELLQLLGEWQPDNDRWLQQLQGLDHAIAASSTEATESTASAQGEATTTLSAAPGQSAERGQ